MTGDEGTTTCTACGVSARAGTRFCAMCGTVLTGVASQEAVRRHVVVLFADLADFTSMSERLDPELLRAVLDRYFRLVSAIIWGYGGVTEKFIGDAVMAVFGMPIAHEDDGLRAVQAAADIIIQLRSLNAELARESGLALRVRIGVHAGLVSASYAPSGDFRVIGDVVNTASRLQLAARSDQVLIGDSVARTIQPHVRLDRVGSLTVKGKQAPVRAWRLLDLEDGAAGQTTPRTPLIGRELELAQLRRAFERVVKTRSAVMTTIVGPAGIGKSRLASEFRSRIADQRLGVLAGRARSYARNVAYHPIIELLESAPGTLASLEAKAAADSASARALAALTRLSRSTGVSRPGGELEEIAWALRALVVSCVESGPVLLIWEDLQWAEHALLDVIEYLGSELGNVPVMQLCIARPTLRDLRPSWPGGSQGAMTLELSPLAADEMLHLVTELARVDEVAAQDVDEVCERVAVASEGNPLFAELMLDMEDDPSAPVPHAITAVFAARLDQLSADERLVLEMAAVAGRDFTSGEIQHLLRLDDHEDLDLRGTLDTLRRARLLTGSPLSARHGFAQAFCRETTYELAAKSRRLRWHLSLADRTEASAQLSSGASKSLLAYHLESAALLGQELHPLSVEYVEVGIRASAVLAAQASDAMNRQDLRAAAGLLERALQMRQASAAGRVELVLRLSDTWLGLGEPDRAVSVLGRLAQAGSPQPVVEIQRELIEMRGGHRTHDQVLDAEQRIARRIDPNDELSWCRFHQLRADRHLMHERVGEAEACLASALSLAAALADEYEANRIRGAIVELTVWGPTPVADGLRSCGELAAIVADSRVSLVRVLGATGGLLGLDGRLAAARDALSTAMTYARELRMRSADIALFHLHGIVESVAGAHDAAARYFGQALDILRAADQAGGVALLDAYATRETVRGGAPVPARYAQMTDEALDAIHDPRTASLTLTLCARAASEDGATRRAGALAVKAMNRAERMQDPFFQGTIHQDIAVLMAHAGKHAKALMAARSAQDCYLAKGARGALPAVEDLLSRLSGASGHAQEGT
jgi:class 3 adenylate cyclase/tetratricopeptide (TPR) repeat protein